MTVCFKVTDANRNSFPGRAIRYRYGKDQLIESDILGVFLFRRRKDAEDYIGRFQTLLTQDIVGPVGIEPPTFPLEIHRVKTIGRGKRMPYCPIMIHGLHGLEMEPVVEFKNTLLRYMGSAPYVEGVGEWVTFMGYDVLSCAPGTVVYPGVVVLD